MGSVKNQKHNRGQAILEYILLVVMVAAVVAVAIRSSNQKIYNFWTGLARQVSSGCADCDKPDGPTF